MEIYYEVQDNKDGVRCFHTLEDATDYADAQGFSLVSEIGGSWTDYYKCEWCGEWLDNNDINVAGICYRCERAIEDHMGPQE